MGTIETLGALEQFQKKSIESKDRGERLVNLTAAANIIKLPNDLRASIREVIALLKEITSRLRRKIKIEELGLEIGVTVTLPNSKIEYKVSSIYKDFRVTLHNPKIGSLHGRSVEQFEVK